ncbi:hypothetical protein [Acinetobacter bouvetii]|uniref:Uncharacterized protein n=1 Tax=Acinetobacter bouvetii TaxID=202951 RepID=A0A811G610_9GAMM|nr:hypothetical protein [Acinetobacter bouvetii]CAB1208195.1 hypothetical protein SFB21_0348 [Acinetobacter bouvetii]
MNVLEKVMLIKELNFLIDGLEQRSLSFFEIARSKTRIKEIFALCDEPIFKKQIIKFKSQTQPKIAALDFADQTLFKLSFRGFFQQENALEQALYQHKNSGWATLYHPKKGWQIWLIPAPERTALISEWGDLDDAYQWMMAQQQLYACLKTDYELKNSQNLIERQIVPVLTEIETHINSSIETQRDHQFNAASDLNIKPVEIALLDEPLIQIDSSQPSEQSSTISANQTDMVNPVVIESIAGSVATKESHGIDSNVVSHTPQRLQLNAYTAQLHLLQDREASAQQLFKLEIASQPEILQHIDFFLQGSDLQDWANRPVYLAEQMDQYGRFIKYLALLGADNPIQAIDCLRELDDHHHLAAIKDISWNDLSDGFSRIEDIFQLYNQKANSVWQSEDYMPFIPTQLIQNQKFIQFEESAADCRTPLLLLKERQKIRIIHGQKRLSLLPAEAAYPYLMLERHHGITWQMIQRIVSRLNPPIDCQKLYKEIQKHISD